MENSDLNKNHKIGKIILKVLWWIFLFPVALTVYIAKNKKLNNVAKGVMIALVWLMVLAWLSFNSSNQKNKKDDPNTTQSETSVENDERSKSDNSSSNKSKNPLELSLGDTYDDNGVKVTLESLEKEGSLNKLKVKIENDSSNDYSFSMLVFWLWTIDGGGIGYASGKNSDDVVAGKTIKPGEKFEPYIYAESGDVSYITYSLITKNHKSNPTAKWIIKKDTRSTAEKDQERKDASEKARESFKNLTPYPSEVSFPALDYAIEQVDGGFYQYGYLKYKNSYGNKIKSEYRMWYNKDGTLTKAELGGKTLK